MDSGYKLWWIKFNGLRYSDRLIMTRKSNSLPNLILLNNKRKKQYFVSQKFIKWNRAMKRFMFTFNYLEFLKILSFFSIDAFRFQWNKSLVSYFFSHSSSRIDDNSFLHSCMTVQMRSVNLASFTFRKIIVNRSLLFLCVYSMFVYIVFNLSALFMMLTHFKFIRCVYTAERR